MTENDWHVYIVECADRTLYTGVAKGLEARIDAHNAGRGAKYTRGRRPVELVYSEVAADRPSAQRRELEIKKLGTEAKRALLRAQSPSRKRRVKPS
jgi:putative endonuclease